MKPVRITPSEQIVLRQKREVQKLRGKPPIDADNFWCAKCHKVPEKVGISFASADTGVKRSQTTVEGPEVLDCYEGYIQGFAECHGQFCDIYASYENAWLALDQRKPITLFEPDNSLRDKEGPFWCNSHNRKATEFHNGCWRCDRRLGGLMIACRVVDLTGIAEIEEKPTSEPLTIDV